MLTSKQVYNKTLLKKAQVNILSSGLNNATRKKYWTSKCNIKEDSKLYKRYCLMECNCDNDIDKDITRTFNQTHQFCTNNENYMKLKR
jgi:hypothetical protein